MNNTILQQANVAFTIDKNFNNKTEMMADTSVYPGRFVMVKYCEAALDYKTRHDLENGSSTSSEDEETYKNNYSKDQTEGYIKSYDRYVFKRVMNDYEEICCVHPMDNSTYSDAVIEMENLNIKNGTGRNSLQQKIFAEATGLNSFAANTGTAAGDYSSAFGQNTRTTADNQFVCGKLNLDDSSALFAVGNGQPGGLNNAFTVYKTGGVTIGEPNGVKGYDVSGLDQEYKTTYIQILNSKKVPVMSETTAWVFSGGKTLEYPVRTDITEGNLDICVFSQSALWNSDDKILFIKGEAGSDTFSVADNSLSIGEGNFINGKNSIVIGTSNVVQSDNSFSAGQQNELKSAYSFSLGRNNKDMCTSQESSILLGDNLISYDVGAQTVVGQYNKQIGAEFVVGSGSSEENRKNSFVVQGVGVFAPEVTLDDFYVRNDSSLRTNIPTDKLLITREMLIDIAHPIGSYYWSSKATTPADLFPGTNWVQIKDRFVLAAGDEYSVDQPDGGAETHKHDQGTLEALIGSATQDPLTIAFVQSNKQAKDDNAYVVTGKSYSSNPTTRSHNTKILGETSSTSSMPPYTIAYCWRRES